MAKISVIMPVFNVEEYLYESLDSVINQSLKDIEIICIDDGSTDSSQNILREYAEKDDRIVILTQDNNGAGSARNLGIDNANGEYIYFMDSDDILTYNSLEIIYDLAESKSLDLVIFKLINFYNETNEKFNTSYYDMVFLRDVVGDKIFNYKDIPEYVFSIAVSPPGKLFKKEVLSDIRFPEGVIYEDNLFFTEVLFNCERIYFYDEYLYCRRIRQNSVSSVDSPSYNDAISCLNGIIDLTKKYGLFDIFKENLYNKKINNLFYRLENIDSGYKEDFFINIKRDFLDNKLVYENDTDFLNVLTSRNKYIFYSILSSDSFMECNLDVKIFDSGRKQLSSRKPKLSIIIPVYNEESIISRSILSAVNQTLDDIEIICIDDGSSDNSLKLLKNISKKYDFLRVFSQKNKGSGKARNYGIDVSKGDYIAFLDADDFFIDNDALKKLYDVGMKNNANMVSGNIKLVDDNNNYLPFKDLEYYKSNNIILPEEYGIPWSFYKSIFKREFLMDNNILFPDLIRGQDPVFLANVLSKLDDIFTVNTDVYAYYYIDGANKCDTFKKRFDHILHFKYVFDYLKDPKFINVVSNFKKKLFIFMDMMGEEGAFDTLKSIREVFHFDSNLVKECESYYYLKFMNNNEMLDKLKLIKAPRISVIVPVYNADKFLDDAISSLINQSFEDIELICVNDGSTDNSLNILSKYADIDSRIKIIDQKNSGCGAARNKALDIASGEYIYFFDPDDYISENTFELLYKNAVHNNSDLVIFKIARFKDKESIDYNNPGFDFDNHFKGVDFNNFIFSYKDVKRYVLNSSFAPWSKLYKKEFLDKYDDFRFETNIAFDDVPFHVQSMLRASKISFVPEFLYYYRFNPNSINNTSSNGMDIFKICRIVENFLKKENYFDEFKDEFLIFKVTQILNYILSTDSDKYFDNALKEFLQIELGNVGISNFHKNRFNLVLESNSLNDYKKKIIDLRLVELENQNNDLKKEIAVYKDKINILEEKNNDLLLTIDNLFINQIKNSDDSDIEFLQNRVKLLNDKNKYLLDKNKYNENLLKSLLSSRSWRITKFLRVLTNKFRHYFK